MYSDVMLEKVHRIIRARDRKNQEMMCEFKSLIAHHAGIDINLDKIRISITLNLYQESIIALLSPLEGDDADMEVYYNKGHGMLINYRETGVDIGDDEEIHKTNKDMDSLYRMLKKNHKEISKSLARFYNKYSTVEESSMSEWENLDKMYPGLLDEYFNNPLMESVDL